MNSSNNKSNNSSNDITMTNNDYSSGYDKSARVLNTTGKTQTQGLNSDPADEQKTTVTQTIFANFHLTYHRAQQ